MDAPRAGPGDRATPALAWAALAALVALGLWLRLRAAPGPWGTDALGYAERALADGPGAADTRSQRVVFVALVRAGLGLTDGAPIGASLPGIALSAIVAPALFLAARFRAGAWLALLPAAIWAVLGLDIEETVEISADAATALPAALAALALAAARHRHERGDGPAALRWLVAAGAACGAGVLVKETALFALAAAAAGALFVAPPANATWRRRAACATAVVVAAVATIALGAAAGVLQRPEVAAGEPMRAPIRWDAPGFAARVTFGVPQMLLTATGAFGMLHVVALPLIARLPFRAARGSVFAAASLAGLVAFDLCPVSTAEWAVLPATFPRYVIPVLPFWLLALVETLGDTDTTRAERAASLLAAAAGLAFAGRSVAAGVLVPPALLLAAWTCLPVTWRRRVPASHSFALAAAALVCAAVAAFTTPWARTSPDATWSAWSVLPATGTVHADRLVGRRLRIAARATPADAARVRLLDDELPPPASFAPGDVLLVRRGTRLAASAAARGDLRATDDALGETVVFRPRE